MAAINRLKPTLLDYIHAERIFRDNIFQYAPRFKFQFHVFFDIDQEIYYAINTPPEKNVGLVVKTVRLPQYSIQTHQMNQYNRKRIVNTKIKYDPVTITFHDDNSNTVRNMWYNYYSYYFDDPNNSDKSPRQAANEGNGNSSRTPIQYDFTDRDQYAAIPPSEINQSWGYVGEGNQNGIKKPFFKNIIIYGFSPQKTYVAYTLVNPVITSFQHDTYSYADGNGTMENTMSIDYEFVKYDTGAFSGDNPSAMVLRFAEDTGTYDFTKSPNKYFGRSSSDGVSQNNETVTAPPDYSGYNTPSGDPYDSGDFLPSNVDNYAYKNPQTTATRPSNAIGLDAAVAEALGATDPNNGRNLVFSTPSYGGTPTNIGTADSTNNPGISPDSDAVFRPGVET